MSFENFINSVLHRHSTVTNSGAETKIVSSTTGKQTVTTMHSSGTSKHTDEAGNESSYLVGDKRHTVVGSVFSDHRQDVNNHIKRNKVDIIRGDKRVLVGSGNAEAAKKQKDLLGKIHQYKSLFETQRTGADSVFNSPLQSKGGSNKSCPACSSGKKELTVNNSNVEYLKQFPQVNNTLFKSLNSVISFISSLITKVTGLLPATLTQFPKKSECKVCGGSGISPSSQDGNFPVESKKQEIPNLYKSYAGEMAKAEEQLGDGGNYILEVTKNMVISVGTVPNDLDSVRVDKKGKSKPAGVGIGEKGTYTKQTESPVVEKVHVDNLAGGTLTMLGNNGVNLIAGAGGIKFRSLGGVDFGGTMSNFTGEQVNIGSENEVNIHGGARLSLEGKILSLKAGDGEVVLDCNLAVSGNAKIKGGLYVEGELFVNHITGQLEATPTDINQPSYGEPVTFPPKIIGYVDLGDLGVYPVFTSIGYNMPDPDSILVYSHRHMIRSIPMSLMGSNKDVREAAASVESTTPVVASKVDNGVKGPMEVVNKMFTPQKLADSSTLNEQHTPIKITDYTPSADSGASILNGLKSVASNTNSSSLLTRGESLVKSLGLDSVASSISTEAKQALGMMGLSNENGGLSYGTNRVGAYITSNLSDSTLQSAVKKGATELANTGIASLMNGATNTQDVIDKINSTV